MNIIVDCGSGDFAPYAPFAGAISALQAYDAHLTLVGDASIFASLAETHKWTLPPDRVTFVHTAKKLLMTDEPMCVVREKADSSMAVALKLLAEGQGDALVSAGNTGALHAGSALLVRRVRGVRRCAIATMLPLQKPTLLLDAGANTVLTPYQLWQFAKMGSVYMKHMADVQNPKIGLVNIGKEVQKGAPLHREAYALLQNDDDIDFFGNVEGHEIPESPCDILVTDGFSGNLILKLLEGMSAHVLKKCKEVFERDFSAKASAFFAQKPLGDLFATYRAATYGGAPFLGIARPIVKAHGNSKADAVCAAIGQAIRFASSGIVPEIGEVIAAMPKENDTTEKGDCHETEET